MVFFVLSGFLISSSVIRDCQLRRFLWQSYISSRLTRLYLVLIPGLLLTILWDSCGLHMFATSRIYTGTASGWINDYFNVAARLRPEIALGNLFFLQTVLVPPLGSNEPLWSLAYEFWYYCLFPLICVGLLYAPNWWYRCISLGALAIIAVLIGRSILIYFPIWLFGSALSILPRMKTLSRSNIFCWTIIGSLLLFAAVTIANHLDLVRSILGISVIAKDYLTAVGFSILLYVLLHDRRNVAPGAYSSVARLAAGFSYTLYVVHIPLLVFLQAAFVAGRPWQPTPFFVALAILLSLTCIGYAFVIAQMTEARTPVVRTFLKTQSKRLGFA
jgi:peptidoglycan/LPS O-acetylase OafA/YrhL